MNSRLILSLPLLGRLTVELALPWIRKTAGVSFQPYLQDEVILADSSAGFRSRLTWSCPPLAERLEAWLQEECFFGRHLHVRRGRLIHRHSLRSGWLQWSWSVRQGQILLETERRFLPGLFSLLLAWRGRDALRANLLQDLLLHPLFSLYECATGLRTFHGSLLVFRDRTLILTGPNGVGKSTLAQKVSAAGGCRYSDNYVMAADGKALALALHPLDQSCPGIRPLDAVVLLVQRNHASSSCKLLGGTRCDALLAGSGDQVPEMRACRMACLSGGLLRQLLTCSDRPTTRSPHCLLLSARRGDVSGSIVALHRALDGLPHAD